MSYHSDLDIQKQEETEKAQWQLWGIRKEGRKWKLKTPHGIETFRTKTRCQEYSVKLQAAIKKQSEPDEPDATCFVDMEVKDKPDFAFCQCQVCKGYGGWVIRQNAYGAGNHFKASCSQCNGWGWVSEEDSKCVHDWVHTKVLGNCYNEYTCKHCKKTWNIDSSD